MTALILCNGEPPSLELLERYRQQADLIVCTDGAWGWLRDAGCRPQVIVGDMDSCTEPPACEIVDCGPHEAQENSDSEKALLLALDRGATEIVFLGATHRRLDHTLANVWLAAKYHGRARIVLVDDYGACEVVSGHRKLCVNPGSIISLVPLTRDVVVHTEGLKWRLNGPLEPGSRGLSNEAVSEEVTLDVATGLVAVVVVSHRT
ncbi:MAG: thiamine diphosphokinase [Armatimonadetes bacterium CG_4_8_14_3_um_filter_66_20]|nr:MAG: thiamine diphosphokinase [Armatimonadetes bacterium CG_4_8_14_3_um_filter_66_20]